ncbi:MAG: class F sortase [Jatrophihabitantaceae bacterium]
MSAHARRLTTRMRVLSLAGVVLLVCGVIAIVIAVQAQKSAPQPPASAASPVAVTPSTARSPGTPPPGSDASTAKPAATTPSVHGPILARSIPTHLTVPAIGVNSNLKQIGLTKDGQIQTPPLVRDSHAYWLTVSPTPGQLGPATIIGHVDSAAYGPGVFFDLGKVRQRDTIEVTRADGTVAVFEVTHVNEYKKAGFPTDAVYGNTDNAALRLITCGGTFNSSERSYESNIVVYADLVSSHHT